LATMKQIAELAGVSRGTVDRVLNRRGSVRPETAARIREIADSLHYVPNRAARILTAQKHRISIGCLLFSTENPFFEDVLAGIHKKSSELAGFGCDIILRELKMTDAKAQLDAIDSLVSEGVHGIVLTPFNDISIAARINRLASEGIPVVTVNTDIEHCGRLAYVGSDYYRSGITAGGLLHLIAGDRAAVGVLTGSENVLCHSERIAGFRQSISQDYPGIRIAALAENHDDDFESFLATQTMLTAHPEIDALFCVAAGVYGACKAVIALGKQKKLKIICYDTVPNTREMLQNGIISAAICQDPFRQGAKSIELLFDYLMSDIQPQRQQYFTDLTIKIRENL
jgi:LacI family transcriptional regulator